MAGYINGFRLNYESYHHYIFCSEDDRVECHNDEGEVEFIYTANCQVLDGKTKEQIGRVGTRDGTWYFAEGCSIFDDVVLLTSEWGDDLLRFEMDISKFLLGNRK